MACLKDHCSPHRGMKELMAHIVVGNLCNDCKSLESRNNQPKRTRR